MFFVDHDESEIFERREDRAPRSDHDPGAARADLLPFIVALPFREMAVQDCDEVLRFGEPAFETLDRLRSERNLGNEHDCRLPLGNGRPDGLKINLRFSTPGHSMKQNWLRSHGRGKRLLDRLQRDGLLLIEDQIRGGNELFLGVRVPLHCLFL